MTRYSDFQLEQCIVCHSKEFESTLLGESLADASDFQFSSEQHTRYRYELTTCKKCGHASIKTDNPCWLPTRKHSFIRYSEPTEHYPIVSNILKSLNIDFSDTSIHTFSYKDFQLANFLTADLGIKDVNLGDWASNSDYWLPDVSIENSVIESQPLRGFLAEIDNSKNSHKIVLITRFFDHVAGYELIHQIIRIASSTVHIIFDLNDYDRLFKLGTLEFLWNERRHFFRLSDLEILLSKAGSQLSTFVYESEQVSPTLTGVISHLLPEKTKNHLTSSADKIYPDLHQRLKSLRNRWQENLVGAHKLGIIGASHKGISLAQFILDARTNHSLHDDKVALKGKNPPVATPLGFHLVAGYDFSSYTHIAITAASKFNSKLISNLRNGGFEGNILDFDCKSLD